MKKRVLVVFLALMMCLGPVGNALAADTVTLLFEDDIDAAAIPIYDQTAGSSYRLGDTGAGVTVLIAGRCACSITRGVIKEVQKIFQSLHISDGIIFLLDIDGTENVVQHTVESFKERPDEFPDVHVAWNMNTQDAGLYEYLFWTFYDYYLSNYSGPSFLAPGSPGFAYVLPSMCILNGELEPISYLGNSAFDMNEENLTTILNPFAGEAHPAMAQPTVAAEPATAGVIINGIPVLFDAYCINGANYFKLRDLAFVLSGTGKQFEVSWDGAANCVSLSSGQSYTAVGGEMTGQGSGTQTAKPTSSKILKDGQEIFLTVYNINGANYFKLRDIGEAFNFGVDWDQASRTISIDTSKDYTPDR